MIKKAGPPIKKIDWKVLDAILQFKPSMTVCSEILGMSHDTIERRIKSEHGMTFKEYRDKKMSRMKMSLAKKQFETAMNGNVTMLIWLGKQYLGQSEKVEQTTELAVNPTQIELRAKKD